MQAQTTRRRSWYLALVLLLWLLVIVPRLIYFNLGPDIRRLSDTHLEPWSLSLLQSIEAHHPSAYLTNDNKYTLVGVAAVAVPIVLYYEALHIRGAYESAADFMHAYVLRETTEYFWIQAEMLLINAVAIALTLYLAYAYTRMPARRGYLYALALVATSAYAFTFATAPRIHSFMFLMTALTLWASFRLVSDKSWINYALAFGAAGLSLSIAQTGIVSFSIPVFASAAVLEHELGHILWRRVIGVKNILWGLFGLALGVVLGYPRIILGLLRPSQLGFYGSVVSTHHPRLVFFGPDWLPRMVQHSYVLGEPALALTFAVFLAHVWWWKREAHVYEMLAALNIVVYTIFFFPLWGGVIGGYYILVILPSLIYLGSQVLLYAEPRKILYAVLLVGIFISGVRVVTIARIMLGGETVYHARTFVLNDTNTNDTIVGTIDANVLGIAPTPAILKSNPPPVIGLSEQAILQGNLVGPNSRNYIFAASSSELALVAAHPTAYQWVLREEATGADDASLCKLGFVVVHKIISHPQNIAEPTELVSVHSFFDILDLQHVTAIGPNITIYKRGSCLPAQ